MPVPRPIRHPAAALALSLCCSAAIAEPAGLSWVWERDEAGVLTGLVAPGDVRIGIETEAHPDGDAIAVTRTVGYPDDRRSFNFDADGRLRRAGNGTGATAFRYDAQGRPVGIDSADRPSLHYDLDVLGRLQTLRIGEIASFSYGYDYLDRIARVETPVGPITYTYHRASGTITRELPNGITTQRSHDAEGLLTEISHADAARRIIARFRYRYRPDGLIGEIEEYEQQSGERTCSLAYDVMERLVGVGCDDGAGERFSYDALSNLTGRSAAGAAPERFESGIAGILRAKDGVSVPGDARGHVRALPYGQATVSYGYDGAGQLAAAGALQYRHDALGWLVERAMDEAHERYLPDPFAEAWQPLWRASGTDESVYLWDGAVPLLEIRDGAAIYRLEDHLGSTRAMLDARGQVVAWPEYTAYGVPSGLTASAGLQPGFAGLFWDAEAGLYLTAQRAYDPRSARFLQPDPVLRIPDAERFSHTLYGYAGGDPVNYVDRDGADPRMVENKLPGAAFDLAVSTSYRRSLDLSELLGVYLLLSMDRARDAAGDAGAQPDGLAQAIGRTSVGVSALPSLARPRSVDVSEALGKLGDMRARSDRNRERVLENAQRTVQFYGKLAETITMQQLEGAERAWGLFSGSYMMGAKLGLRALSTKKPFDLARAYDASGDAIKIGKLIGTLLGGPDGPSISKEVQRPDLLVLKNHGTLTDLALGSGGSGSTETMPSMNIMSAYKQAALLGRIGVLQDAAELSAWQAEAVAAPSPARPTRVGGVYLGGAGALIAGLGEIAGVAVDEVTGGLVFIGRDGAARELPNLRIDDVVTIFRAVYDHGQAPSVTIDPVPADPKGPVMEVKHGPGTAASYVGWVLYQCDRVMKSYMLGEDNITGATITTAAPGYAAMQKTHFFDGGGAGAWERFWIVPAKVRRVHGREDATDGTRDAALLDVSLGVNTQKMHWVGGALVDDSGAASSRGAEAFATWFTANIDAIATEVTLLPPPETDIARPVRIFDELARMATVTAIAEHLRDRGVPLPAWMRDHRVTPVPVDTVTPSLTVQAADGGTAVAIFGGVRLAPADRDVEDYQETGAKLPGDDAAASFVALSRDRLAGITGALPALAIEASQHDLLAPRPIPGKSGLAMVFVPGAETRAPGANRLAVQDLAVPMGRGQRLTLTRHLNSFFDPEGTFGRGWSLDLPRLVHDPVPVARGRDSTTFAHVARLTSPLGSVEARFDGTAFDPGFDAELPVDPDHPEIRALVRTHSPLLDADTWQVLFVDGTTWHFEDDGALVLVEAEGIATRYLRDGGGRLHRIVGYLGDTATAEIRLDFDDHGRIVAATGQSAPTVTSGEAVPAREVRFAYDSDGRLACVGGAGAATDCARGYSYEEGRLTAISTAGEAFTYSDSGELLSTQHGAALQVVRRVPDATGQTVTVGDGEDDAAAETWRFDPRMRPVAWRQGAAARDWRYPDAAGTVETLRIDERLVTTRTLLPDGRLRLERPGQPVLELSRADGTVTLAADSETAAEITRHPDGTLAAITTPGAQITPRHDASGLQTGVLLSAPMEAGGTTAWIEEDLDLLGRPVAIREASGWSMQIGYDHDGRIASLASPGKDGRLTGRIFDYDAAGQLAGIRSSWGDLTIARDETGRPQRVAHVRGGASASVAFDAEGRPVRADSFAGGTTTWQYGPDSDARGPVTITLPDGTAITRHAGAGEIAQSVEVRTDTADIRVHLETDSPHQRYTWSETPH